MQRNYSLMRCRPFVLLLSTLLAMCIAHPADAQLLKKIFGKKKKKKKTEQTVQPPAKKTEFDYPATEFKNHYRVDVLAPIYLDELVKDNKAVYKGRLPDKANAGLDFYRGIKLAADTLNKQLYKLDVYMHDITDTLRPLTYLLKGELDSSDLIIGVLQSDHIPEVATFAKKHHINFISALSPSDAGVRNNPYFTLLQPGLQTHCERIKEQIAKQKLQKKVLLCYRKASQVDVSAYEYLYEDLYNEKDISFKKLLCDTMPNKAKFKALLDTCGVNVLVLATMDNTFADSFLRILSLDFTEYNFEVYGMPSWRGLSSLRKANNFPNVRVFVTAPFYVDNTGTMARAVDKMYHREYGGKPAEMCYKGFETLFWYASLLRTYGTIFNKKMNEDHNTVFTPFYFKPKTDAERDLLYTENRHLYLYRYENGVLKVED